MNCTKCKLPIDRGQKFCRTKQGPHHRQCPGAIQAAYLLATIETGLEVEELKTKAVNIFASILYHAARRPGETIWTVASIREGLLNVEVNYPPTYRNVRASREARA
jgi:hypothetical protein